MITKHQAQPEDPCLSRSLRHAGLLSRCETITQNFRPAIASAEHIQDDSLYVEVTQEEDTPLSQNDLGRLGRSLALQLGIRVVISNAVATSQHQAAELNSQSLSQALLEQQPNASPVVIEPTVYTLVQDKPFSNIYDTVPADILSRIYAKSIIDNSGHNLSQPGTHASAGIKGALQKFGVSIHEAKIRLFDRFLHVVIDATPDIIEEDIFYELTQELAKAVGNNSLVVTIIPSRMQTLQDIAPGLLEPESSQVALPSLKPDSINFEELKHLLQVQGFCKKLQQEIGTTSPYTVSLDPSSQQCLVQLLYKKAPPDTYKEVTARINKLGNGFGVSALVQSKHATRNTLILNQGKRSSISHDEMVEMAALLRANLRITENSEWALITPASSSAAPHGNCVEVFPKVALTPSVFNAIKTASAHIPVPVLLHRVKSSQEPLSVGAVKALTKLLLPPWASLESVHVHPAGKISLNILSSRTRWTDVQQTLGGPFKAIDPDFQRIIFNLSERHGDICQALSERSDVYRKAFIRNMNSEGIISIPNWEVAPNRTIKLKDVSWRSLQERYPSIIDRVDLPVSLWDPAGTSRAEDGISLVVKDGILTQGIHFANAAIQLDQFSVERHKAYHRGDSLYVVEDDLAIVSHMMPGLGRYTFREGVVAPALSVFIDYNLDALNDPAAIAQSIANARAEPTFVRPSAAHLYPHEQKTGAWLAQLPKQVRRELQLLSQIDKALQLHSAGRYEQDSHHSLSPRSHIASSLYLANHILAKLLQDSGLPCLFQATRPPSLRELASCLRAIRLNQAALPELRDYAVLQVADIQRDPTLLSKLYARARLLPRQRRDLCNFPRLQQVSTTTPEPHLLSGYTPFVAANTGFRKLPSLIAQHQLSASLGLVAPLSRGEVESLHSHHTAQHELGYADKIETDLRLIGLFRYLKARQADPITVHVTKAPDNGYVEVDARLPFDLPVTCQVVLSGLEQENVRVGDHLRVLPTYYSLGCNRLLFKVAP